MERNCTCNYCRRELEIGSNVLGVQQGVLGPQRFIPLEETALFCSDECVTHAFDNTPKMPPRIP